MEYQQMNQVSNMAGKKSSEKYKRGTKITKKCEENIDSISKVSRDSKL